MIKRDAYFDRLWSEVEAGSLSSEDALDRALPAGLEGMVAAAALLRRRGMGMTPPALDEMWQGIRAHMPVPESRTTPARVRSARRRWRVRVVAGLAAAVLLLAAVSRQALPGSRLYPVRMTMERAAVALVPDFGGLRLRIAEARLADLLVTLEKGPFNAAPSVARAMVTARRAALSQGAEVSALDARIASEVPPALRTAPTTVAQQVRAILGSLLPPDPSGSAGGNGSAGAIGTSIGSGNAVDEGRHQGPSGVGDEATGGEEGGSREGDREGSGSDGGSGSGSESGSDGGSDSGGGSDSRDAPPAGGGD